MEIHGYSKEEQNAEDLVPAELAEITLVASPDELRRIAKFLENCASGIEEYGKSWSHEHLSDQDKSFESSPHFVVYNPEYEL
ncbi:Imm32 family immunity protein [Pseudomonas fluvialis]|uniref:Imm32 family immunity protein n=1 Tax=Pseudomonas fluvialis TaxID=1793966 RepID=UPI004040C0F1